MRLVSQKSLCDQIHFHFCPGVIKIDPLQLKELHK